MSIMDGQKSSKLNRVLLLCPPGALAPTLWLSEQGISRQLLDRYEEYNWITRAAKGVVFRKGDTPTWQGAVYALQSLLKINAWVGGKTALELKGLAHFLTMSKAPLMQLYSNDVGRLPKWVTKLDDVAAFEFQKTSLFSKESSMTSFSELKFEKINIRASSPERAIFELLEDVPSKQSFEEAELIFENLTNLRPTLVQELLEKCSSIKVKRLFLYLAEKEAHAWFSKLDESKINLGLGKRAIVPHGELNQKYQIIVPRSK